MIRDPIVDEVRAIRDELARENGYDIEKIFAKLRQIEATSGREHALLGPSARTPERGAEKPRGD